ncbi:MAG: hypothetical protein AAF518_02585 [Spirochaetota bacterium]
MLWLVRSQEPLKLRAGLLDSNAINTALALTLFGPGHLQGLSSHPMLVKMQAIHTAHK